MTQIAFRLNLNFTSRVFIIIVRQPHIQRTQNHKVQSYTQSACRLTVRAAHCTSTVDVTKMFVQLLFKRDHCVKFATTKLSFGQKDISCSCQARPPPIIFHAARWQSLAEYVTLVRFGDTAGLIELPSNEVCTVCPLTEILLLQKCKKR